MKEFWNSRYAEEAFAYGTEPNAFFKEKLASLKPAKILLPAEGEGRNAVYAAQQGWEVTAYDISEEGQKKALRLAAEKGVSISYHVGTLDELTFSTEYFDCVALIYAHQHKNDLREIHPKLLSYLRPGGALIIEGFSEEHLAFNSKNPQAGGPKDATFLYTTEQLALDFQNCEFQQLEQHNTVLEEGLYHQGESSVVRCFAIKR
jgi:ubiquinone/menaquinone biosynthesis C-methylase UbiE